MVENAIFNTTVAAKVYMNLTHYKDMPICSQFKGCKIVDFQ